MREDNRAAVLYLSFYGCNNLFMVTSMVSKKDVFSFRAANRICYLLLGKLVSSS